MAYASDTPSQVTPLNAYIFSFHALQDNNELPLAAYRGKVLLIVNTASECGFTPQYEGLEKLYQTYKERGFVIIGVPSNDFGGQEPGSSEQNGFIGAPKWNFHKYLINRRGNLVDYFHSTTEPNNQSLVREIEKLLAQSD